MDKHILKTAQKGLLSGILGGMAYGAALTIQGKIVFFATLLGSSSFFVGMAFHLFMSGINGILFALLIRMQIGQRGEILFWGMVFGISLWIIGPLTVVPILSGALVSWDMATIQKAFPDLIGHFWYGAVTAIVLSAMQSPVSIKKPDLKRSLTPVIRGMATGLPAIIFMRLLFGSFFHLNFLAVSAGGPHAAAPWPGLLLSGLIGGGFYGFLYPHAVVSPGGNLIRGMLYGFFMWIAGPLTLMPLFAGYGIHWDVALARIAFAGLPGFLLLGVSMALFYRGITSVIQLLFGTTKHDLKEGVGTIGVRGLLRGSAAGLAGGILFTFFMEKMGLLPIIAQMAGGQSAGYGLMVHLFISIIIGISYSLMFRRQSVDISSAMGWGISYGFFWWILGGITLMPWMLGSTPQWSATQASMAFPSLIGHLAYGAALGIGAFLIEKRQNPWWITKDAALRFRQQRELEQLQSSAPALWTLTAILAVLIPALLAH